MQQVLLLAAPSQMRRKLNPYHPKLYAEGNPPSSSSSSVWELLPIFLPFIIQQPPSPCSASIDLALIIQQVRMPPKSEKAIYIGKSIRLPQAATGCHRAPQGATGR